MVITKDNCDFGGWATRANMKCSDGRTIMKDAFIAQDGTQVPLVWNHQHTEVENVLGHALLENREEGVYAYCKFNESESGKMGRELVRHGDVNQLSIFANKLKQQGGNVIHGAIREVSLVLAGANPGAYIDAVMCHSENSEEEGVIYTGEDIELAHSEENVSVEEEVVVAHSSEDETIEETKEEETVMVESEVVEHAEKADPEEKEENESKDEPEKKDESEDKTKTDEKDEPDRKEKTVEEMLASFDDEQKEFIYALIGMAREDASAKDDKVEDAENKKENNIKHSEGGNEIMYNNVFDKNAEKATVLTHADQQAIIKMAKTSAVGSLQEAIKTYVSENTDLAHADTGAVEAWNVERLFPDFQNVPAGAPGVVGHDNEWVADVMKKSKKNPAARIRTRHASLLADEYKAKGHKKGSQKEVSEGVKMILRTTDPQTVYVRDELHRDDIIDMDFDIIAFQKNIMKGALEETIAVAALIGDGLEDGAADKISETHIRPVWHDHDVFTIKATINDAMENIQGTDTAANFGANYIFAEAFLETSLTARLQYRGKGVADLYCAPSTVNKMLLARDLNGRRIYDSVADLAKALNVNKIHSVEQMEGKTRENGTRKLLGIYVNMANYTFGSTKGGEITSFEQFDLDFNKQKYLMEARVSGALTEPYSAVAIEEEVAG